MCRRCPSAAARVSDCGDTVDDIGVGVATSRRVKVARAYGSRIRVRRRRRPDTANGRGGVGGGGGGGSRALPMRYSARCALSGNKRGEIRDASTVYMRIANNQRVSYLRNNNDNYNRVCV